MAASNLRFDGRVAIVTGAGNGIGRIYAMDLAARGAKVVVNDLGGSTDGQGASSKAADTVVAEIRAAGGEATANYDSVVDGAKVVATAIEAYGRIDIIVNNAGILRDVSFAKMTEKDWDLVHLVHLKGTFALCHAAWPHMRKQSYGRILNVTSTSGLYGNFGQANYSAAKLGIAGLTNTLAKEGAKRNIKVNTLAPIAGSRMTATVMPEAMLKALKPEFVSPAVMVLVHENVPGSGMIIQAGGGWFSLVSWQRSYGLLLSIDEPMTPEMVMSGWDKVAALPAPNGIPDQYGGTQKDRSVEQAMARM